MKVSARGTFARTAARTSDVSRRRALEASFVVALIASALAAFFVTRASPSPFAWASPGALSEAHRSAGLSCASCHAGPGAATSCAKCHDAAAHQSRRSAHHALEAANPSALSCTTCHPAHDSDARRVEVHLDKWIPVVSTSACAGCHDLANARDPVHRCVAGGSSNVTCFDEHTKSPSLATVAAVRAAVARRSAPTAAPVSHGPLFGAFAFAGIFASVAAYAFFARRKPAPRVVAPTPISPQRRLPVIDASRCLGCRACVDACAFDVLEIARFVAVVARPDACCSAVVCADACPNGSLTLVDGGGAFEHARIGTDLESPDAPGLFLAGDLTGVPLIKNAIRQGREVADRVAARRGPAADDVLDLLIVGAGPAGLSATLRAQELGLSVVALEQGALASSIRAFPRGKLVFERPLTLPLAGDLWMEECTKEELVLQWERVVRAHRLPVRPLHRVTKVAANVNVGGFDVVASVEDGKSEVRFVARNVLFAVGTRGAPRTLAAPIDPAVLDRVAYHLVDAASFAGRRIVVAGLGDAAMEAALTLARQTGCDVTVLHRAPDFTRGSARNVAEMRAAVQAGRLRLAFDADIRGVGPSGVDVAIAGKNERIAFDQMFVLIGGMPPWPLLSAAGVAIRRGEDEFRDPTSTRSV